MQVQQHMFDKHLLSVVLAASNQQTSFDSQMAKSALEARDMRAAYDQLACDNVKQRNIVAQVCPQAWPLFGSLSSCNEVLLMSSPFKLPCSNYVLLHRMTA